MTRPREMCGFCLQEWALRADGTFRSHQKPSCPGSRLIPEETVSSVVIVHTDPRSTIRLLEGAGFHVQVARVIPGATPRTVLVVSEAEGRAA